MEQNGSLPVKDMLLLRHVTQGNRRRLGEESVFHCKPQRFIVIGNIARFKLEGYIIVMFLIGCF